MQGSSHHGSRIAAVASELPPDVVTSAEVEERAGMERLGFEKGWLERVTGVRERRWARPDVKPSDLAAAAGAKALARAELLPADVDTLLFCGITRDFIEPATANAVAATLGADGARVLDVTNACNSLVDGLDLADSLIRTGKARRVLVTTGERASLHVGWSSHTPDELMRAVAGLVVGDGGGALLVEPSDDPERGLREREYRSDPRHWSLAVAGRFRPSTQACEICGSVVDMPFVCDGRRLFEVGFQMMPEVLVEVLQRTGWSVEDLDLVFCHEASRRFVQEGAAMFQSSDNPAGRIWSTVERFGNTSTLSLPLQMSEADDAGRLVPGAKILALAGSSGVSMAAVTMVW